MVKVQAGTLAEMEAELEWIARGDDRRDPEEIQEGDQAEAGELHDRLIAAQPNGGEIDWNDPEDEIDVDLDEATMARITELTGVLVG